MTHIQTDKQGYIPLGASVLLSIVSNGVLNAVAKFASAWASQI